MVGDELIAVSVGPHGQAVALWVSAQRKQAQPPPPNAAWSAGRHPVPARVVTQTAATTTVTHIAALPDLSCRVQPLPDGQVLAVAGRGGRATVFDDGGQIVQQTQVGDGIKHVLTTPIGLVWIGYFDEGIYGPDPLAHHGIACYGTDLQPTWAYPFDTPVG